MKSAAIAEAQRRRRIQPLQVDALTFAARVGFVPDDWQAKVLTSTSTRLLLNCARQSGKSTTTALLSVHSALSEGDRLILLISPSLRQSAELFRKVRTWLSKIPGLPTFIEDNKLSCELPNRSRIVSLPSSEATVRGFSAVYLAVFDEAARVPDGLYRAVSPMLATTNGRMVAMSTPYGKRGWWYQAWADGGDEYERFEVPATKNPRITKEFLAGEKASMPERDYLQEYLCSFEAASGQVFGDDLIGAMFDDTIAPVTLYGDLSLFSEGVGEWTPDDTPTVPPVEPVPDSLFDEVDL